MLPRKLRGIQSNENHFAPGALGEGLEYCEEAWLRPR
jgi:hypothetical protein